MEGIITELHRPITSNIRQNELFCLIRGLLRNNSIITVFPVHLLIVQNARPDPLLYIRLAGHRVELRVKTWDAYGRLVALVMVEGHSFNAELLREGMAWVHSYYCKESICQEWRQFEKEAKKAGRGIWQEKNPVAP